MHRPGQLHGWLACMHLIAKIPSGFTPLSRLAQCACSPDARRRPEEMVVGRCMYEACLVPAGMGNPESNAASGIEFQRV